MATDLMVDQSMLDLISSPSGDFLLVSDLSEIEQRMRLHLRIVRGSYALQPTIGSTLTSLTRQPITVAVTQVPLVVKEALSRMEEIQVQDVAASVSAEDPRKIEFTVVYAVVDDGVAGESAIFNDSIVVSP